MNFQKVGKSDQHVEALAALVCIDVWRRCLQDAS